MKEGGSVFTSVCLSVCLDYSKSCERILLKFLEGWQVAQGTVRFWWWSDPGSGSRNFFMWFFIYYFNSYRQPRI